MQKTVWSTVYCSTLKIHIIFNINLGSYDFFFSIRDFLKFSNILKIVKYVDVFKVYGKVLSFVWKMKQQHKWFVSKTIVSKLVWLHNCGHLQLNRFLQGRRMICKYFCSNIYRICKCGTFFQATLIMNIAKKFQ